MAYSSMLQATKIGIMISARWLGIPPGGRSTGSSLSLVGAGPGRPERGLAGRSAGPAGPVNGSESGCVPRANLTLLSPPGEAEDEALRFHDFAIDAAHPMLLS